MNISGPAAVAKPEMLFYAPGDLTVTFYWSFMLYNHTFIICEIYENYNRNHKIIKI